MRNPRKLHPSFPMPRRSDAALAGSAAGFALVTSLIVLGILTLIAATALRVAAMEEKMTGNQKLLARAQFGAERGISDAIDALVARTISDATWRAANPGWETGSPAWGGANGTSAGPGYSVAYTIRHRRIAGGPVATNDHGEPLYRIDATGTAGNATRSIEVAVALTAPSALDTGLVGCRGISFHGGATIGSYSSSGKPGAGDNGDGKTVSEEVSPGTFIDGPVRLEGAAVIRGDMRATGSMSLHDNAAIQKDAYANGNVSLLGNACIGHDVWSGGAITAATGTGAGCDLTGNGNRPGIHSTRHPNQPGPVARREPCDPLDVDGLFSTASVIRTANDNAELTAALVSGFDYQIGGSDTDTIGAAGQARSFYFDDFTVEGSAVVTLQGDLTFYVEGDFELSGHARLLWAANTTLNLYVGGRFHMGANTFANQGNPPAGFLVHSSAEDTITGLPGDAGVEINSNSGFFGVMYAPRADVHLDSNDEARGAIRGRWVNMDSHGAFWYDEDLAGLPSSGISGYELVYWTEQ